MTRDSRLLPPLILTAAFVVLIAGTVIGFRLLTASADTSAAGPECTERTVAEGETLTANLVTVDVYNTSRRAGLANRASINLQRRGFLGGEVGNSESQYDPARVAILTDDPQDPRVRLVAAQLGKNVTMKEPDVPVDPDHVTVLVGDGFSDLRDTETREVESDRTISACIPVVPVEQ